MFASARSSDQRYGFVPGATEGACSRDWRGNILHVGPVCTGFSVFDPSNGIWTGNALHADFKLLILIVPTFWIAEGFIDHSGVGGEYVALFDRHKENFTHVDSLSCDEDGVRTPV